FSMERGFYVPTTLTRSLVIDGSTHLVWLRSSPRDACRVPRRVLRDCLPLSVRPINNGSAAFAAHKRPCRLPQGSAQQAGPFSVIRAELSHVPAEKRRGKHVRTRSLESTLSGSIFWRGRSCWAYETQPPPYNDGGDFGRVGRTG